MIFIITTFFFICAIILEKRRYNTLFLLLIFLFIIFLLPYYSILHINLAHTYVLSVLSLTSIGLVNLANKLFNKKEYFRIPFIILFSFILISPFFTDHIVRHLDNNKNLSAYWQNTKEIINKGNIKECNQLNNLDFEYECKGWILVNKIKEKNLSCNIIKDKYLFHRCLGDKLSTA